MPKQAKSLAPGDILRKGQIDEQEVTRVRRVYTTDGELLRVCVEMRRTRDDRQFSGWFEPRRVVE